jgi:glycosyltransferase involved in cell wall biosynthesis
LKTKKIILITSAQPSANPRLVKESKALLNANYHVTVIWCPISPWADSFDKDLFLQHPNIKWVKAGYHFQKQPWGYWYARIRQKSWQIIYRIIGNYFDAAIKSVVLFSQELKSATLKIQGDIFIGHNLGALPAIVSASKKFNANNIFDFEDFHRGEYSVDAIEYKMIIDVENKYIPVVDTITTASPSITEAYRSIFPQKNYTDIHNVFPLSYAIDKIKHLPLKPLKLFWFSQYIGKKRGLENVIQAMAAFDQDDIQFTLLGSCTTDIKNYFSSLAESFGLSHKQIIFLEPVKESQIVQIATDHHIGIASEFAHITNRDLCLTNKIFMYMLAGNAILFSNTKSQNMFHKSNKSIGFVYVQESSTSLTETLSNYLQYPQILTEHRSNALSLAKHKYNWDIEKGIFLNVIENLLISETNLNYYLL